MPSEQQPAEQHSSPRSRMLLGFGAGVLIALLVALAFSGHVPEFGALVHFSSNGGLVSVAPSAVTQVEIRAGRENVALRRNAGGWTIDGADGPIAVPAEIASHVEMGLQFLNVSDPMREIPASELKPVDFTEYGLDPPASVVVIGTAGGTAATISFGSLNPVGTSQYLRLSGAGTVYLMPRHVGTEWQVAGDMVRRLRGQAEVANAGPGTGLLLPISIAQVWALEIVSAGKLTRFERDSAGNWFRHTGQHTHSGGANTHMADSAQARAIAAALDAFDQTAIESRVAHPTDDAALGRFGLALPSVIVLLYARDGSAPLARIEIGAATGNFARYARLAPNGEVVTVAEFEVTRLTELLKAVGAG